MKPKSTHINKEKEPTGKLELYLSLLQSPNFMIFIFVFLSVIDHSELTAR